MYEIKLSPRSERETIIADRVEASEEKETLYDFRGGQALPVIILDINTPVYRMENCRTFTEQQELIATKGLDADYFLKGQELSTIQAEQHKILGKLAKKGTTSVSPIIDVLRKDGQRETILISSQGVVINGNRRLCAMREIYAEDDAVNSQFAHVKCQVLPKDTTRDEIDDIEAFLQARPQTKLDYDWIGDARLVRRQVNKGRTTKQVADQLRRSEPEIKNLLQALDEAELYLQEWAEKPGHYSLVSGDAQQIFGDIPKKLSGKDIPLQNASRVIAWSLFDNREKLPGRIYSFNAAFGKLAEEVLVTVSEQLEIPITASGDDSSDDDFAVDIELGGNEEVERDYSGIIEALKDTEDNDEAVDVLIDACQSAIEKEKGQVSKNAALRAISQAHTKLAGVDLSMAGKSTYQGIEKQLKAVEGITGKLLHKLEQLKAEATDEDESEDDPS